MSHKQPVVGIRREDKNEWERRVPLVPKQVEALIRSHGLAFRVQPSDIRVFPDEEFRSVGAEVIEELSDCDLVLGVKEVPPAFFRQDGFYCFFSHVIKGQPANMPMLRRLMDLGCSLVDYERMTDDVGRRLVFFGHFAGIAGAVNTLVALGRRLQAQGTATSLVQLRQAYEYGTVEAAMEAVRQVGHLVRREGIPNELTPLVIGVTGYGHVAQGVLEVLDEFGAVDVAPDQVPGLISSGDEKRVYRTVYREEHMVEPCDQGATFRLQEYYDHPDRYRSAFESRLPYLAVLINCIYWDERYPKLVTKDWLRGEMNKPGGPRLRVIGDVSCDVDGAVEANVRVTDTGSPFYVYHPELDRARDGLEGEGVAVMAVDNLPCELAVDSSRSFGKALRGFVPSLARADLSLPLDELDIPGPVSRSLLLHRGKLTPDYEYIEEFLKDARSD